MKAFINIYRSGHYHRAGKPGAFDCHGGDIYPSESAAREDISPHSHYLCTVPIDCPEMVANAPDSLPIPLSLTRRKELTHGPR